MKLPLVTSRHDDRRGEALEENSTGLFLRGRKDNMRGRTGQDRVHQRAAVGAVCSLTLRKEEEKILSIKRGGAKYGPRGLNSVTQTLDLHFLATVGYVFHHKFFRLNSAVFVITTCANDSCLFSCSCLFQKCRRALYHFLSLLVLFLLLKKTTSVANCIL